MPIILAEVLYMGEAPWLQTACTSHNNPYIRKFKQPFSEHGIASSNNSITLSTISIIHHCDWHIEFEVSTRVLVL
jgi:hypothetical protein